MKLKPAAIIAAGFSFCHARRITPRIRAIIAITNNTWIMLPAE
jgi:hypothetical protein